MDSNFQDLLKQSVPNRFMNLSPFQFEEFLCQLFKDSGYEAEVTKKTGDFGADLLLRKDGKKIAVQVKRYDQSNLVGVKDLNQVLGAMKYYSCETSMVITTTEFTTPAKELARTTNVELWGWEKLYENIKKLYFNGSDIYEYFQKTEAQKGVNDNKIELEVEKVLEKQEVYNTTDREERITATVIHLKIKNCTDNKFFLKIDKPLVIDVLGNQINSFSFLTGSFNCGDVYPYTSIPVIACFYEWQIPKANLIKKIILIYDLIPVEEIMKNIEEYEAKDGEFHHEKIIDMPYMW